MRDLTRRHLLALMGSMSVPALLGQWTTPARAAGTKLTAVEWGGDVVSAMKQIAAQQTAVDVDWVLHQGGAAAILPKIKAIWPRADFDYVAGWEGSFNSM